MALYSMPGTCPCACACMISPYACDAFSSRIHVSHVSGDSAGGALCLATAQRMRDDGLPLPAALVLFSPWVCIACVCVCHVHACYAMLCYAMLCYAMPCYAMHLLVNRCAIVTCVCARWICTRQHQPTRHTVMMISYVNVRWYNLQRYVTCMPCACMCMSVMSHVTCHISHIT